MQNSPRERDPRSRQACEPCRERKIKCTAERPACSCCQRFGRACRYRTRVERPATATGKKAKKSPSLRHRFYQLESQVQNIYSLLQPAPPNGSDLSLQSPTLEADSTTRQDDTRRDNTQQTSLDTNDVDIPGPSPSNQSAFIPASPEVSLDILEEAVDIYRRMIHLQPLPLFRLPNLLDYLKSSPRYLLYSFLALSLSLKAQIACRSPLFEKIEYCAGSAEEEVKNLASQGLSELGVVQSLCLHALRDILLCKPNQAQMTIGMASRLEARRSVANDASSESIDADLSLRCYWSVYILEKIFSPRLCASEEDIPRPDFPQRTPVPPALPSTRHEDYPSDLYNPYNANTDHGIAAYYIRMVSNWGDISLWLHHIRLERPESPWSPESKYARLTARIYECDSQLPAKHLLRNVAFSKRAPSEVLQQREYWIPWVLMQVECHAYLSILNHPFIHLVAVRNCSNGSQSGMFLQHTVDVALFHTGWVFRFLRLCDDHQLQLHDPFIAHLVAAAGTIPWLLQFVEDAQVSQKAAQDVAWCSMYLSRVLGTWPHISQKLETFQNLQLIAEHYRQNSTGNPGAVTFPPALLWELLDPEICHMNPQRAGSGQALHASVQITTHLTHPLSDSQMNHTSADPTSDVNDSFVLNAEDLEQVYMDDFISQFMLYNTYRQVE